MLAPEKKARSSDKTKILLIDDDESEFHLVNGMLEKKSTVFELHWANNLSKGIEHLSQKGADVILLDLFLLESRGLDTFRNLKVHVKDIPIVILSGLDDEQSAIDAVRQGAQDFLVKGQADGNRLSRVIQYAIKRHEVREEAKSTDSVDSLTGLYNRHGFLMMAEQYLRAAQRAKKDFFVCFMILNDLDKINETYGEAEGNQLLLTTTEILKESFRTSDILARIGPDEFALMTSDQGRYSPKVISARIKKNPKYYNAQFNHFRLSLSMCATHFSPSKNLSIKDLAAKADKIFSEYKSKKNTEQFFAPN